MSEDLLARARTGTPLQAVAVRRGAAVHRLWLKLESENPTGSTKYRTALSLLRAIDTERPLLPGTQVVESTSGNLGIALAHVMTRLKGHFIAVVDPKVPAYVRELMRREGARLVMVDQPDQHGGYLLNRLKMVHQMLSAEPQLRWPDQYHNPANPEVHRTVTAAEILRQTNGDVDTALVAVSTGGTLAGISDGLRASDARIRLVAADVDGSTALGAPAHRHLLTGVGASRRSSFLRADHYDHSEYVTDAEAFAMCRLLLQDTGLMLGGSSGVVVAAFLRRMTQHGAVDGCQVAVAPDGGDRYRATVYSDDWLLRRGALPAVVAAAREARDQGISFELKECVDDRNT